MRLLALSNTVECRCIGRSGGDHSVPFLGCDVPSETRQTRALACRKPALSAHSIKSDVARDAVVEEAVAVAEGGPTAKIGLLIEGYEATLQDLLTQIVTYWKVGCPTRLLRQNLVQCQVSLVAFLPRFNLSTTHTMLRPCWLSILMKQSNTPFSLYACMLEPACASALLELH